MSQDFIPTLSILNAVVAAVQALTVPESEDKLFDEVRLYDATDVDKAFADLALNRQKKLCFVLPSKHTYQSQLDGSKLDSAKRINFACLVCDTDRKTGREALFGGDKNLGVIALQEELVDQLTGAQLGLRWVVVEPVEGDDFVVFDEHQSSDPGRKGWFQLFSTRAGRANRSIQRL